jgi:hypothetical protein
VRREGTERKEKTGFPPPREYPAWQLDHETGISGVKKLARRCPKISEIERPAAVELILSKKAGKSRKG